MSKEVILCDTCEGLGYKIKRELVDYHKSKYEYKNETCPRCQGSGRLWKRTIIEFAPFIPE